MLVIAAELEPIPSIAPADIPDAPDIADMSDDECLARLAEVVREQDPEHLDELAQLMARLAVTVE